jgi:hypothetical protein
MKPEIFLLLLVSTAVIRSSKEDFTPKVDHRHFIECLKTTAKRNFPPGQSLVISFQNKLSKFPYNNYFERTDSNLKIHSKVLNTYGHYFLDFLLEELHSAQLWPMNVYKRTNKKDTPRIFHYWGKHNAYIILVPWNKAEEFGLRKLIYWQIQYLESTEQWNPRSKFVVVIMGSAELQYQHAVLDILEELWEEKIVNVVVVVVQPEEGLQLNENNFASEVDYSKPSTIDLYTWFPFQSPYRCNSVHDIVLIDRWLLDGKGRLMNNSVLFPNKTPRNLHTCPLIAVTDYWGHYVNIRHAPNNGTYLRNTKYRHGLEVLLFRAIAEALNMTAVLRNPLIYDLVWGQLFANSNSTGVMGDIKDGRANISFRGLPKHLDQFERYAESTHSYLESGFHWYVQCPKPHPRWQTLCRIFSPSLWFIFMAVNILISVLIWWFAKLANESPHRESDLYVSFHRVCAVVFAIFVNYVAPKLPRTPALRVLFAFLLGYALAFNTVFESRFVSLLVDPGEGKRVTSVDELLRSDTKFVFVDAYADLFAYPDDREKDILLRRINCSDFEACAKIVATSGDSATVLDTINYFNYEYLLVDENYNTQLCQLNELIKSYPISMYMTKGSPLLESVNNIILLTLEGGLVEHWWRVIIDLMRVRTAGQRSEFTGSYRSFSMRYMYVAFLYLILGLVMSTLVFACEHLFQRLQTLLHTHQF